jgi:Arsenate reductase and related proteins, glutaredoxin family
MNILLYGTKKCADTRKAQRFFRERRIPVQFRDLAEKPLAEGELKNLCAGGSAAGLVDEGSAAYAKRGLAWKEYDPFEELLADNGLLKTPVIRMDRTVFVRPVLDTLPLDR